MKYLLFSISLFSLCILSGRAQETTEQVVGSWLGTLNASGVQLRIVFNISSDGEGALSATMDSPDQGAWGLPTGNVSFSTDTLVIEAPGLLGRYSGTKVSDTLIEGTWEQAGRRFELDLEKLEGPLALNRPQEPLPPFPYRVEEITFENQVQNITLGGTLTIPEGDGPFPGVILVSGSGSQNRDEELFGHKPFLVLADQLTRNGIAVFRYDDRGVGSSGGTPAGSSTADYATDARAAFEYLRQREETDPGQTGVIGHSEGGTIAFMLASEYEEIAFIVSLAGPGTDGKTVLLDQSEYINRLGGVEESALTDNRNVMGTLYQLMEQHEYYGDWLDEAIPFVEKYYTGESAIPFSDQEIEQIKQNILLSISGPAYAWMRFFVMFDPQSAFASIKCPLLALNGEKDCQVLAEKNIGAIEDGLALSGHKQYTCSILPGLNHLFQHCDTGLPDEYGTIEETFDPGTITLISEWILQQAVRPPVP